MASDTRPQEPGWTTGDELIGFARRLGYSLTMDQAEDVAAYRASTEPIVASLRDRADIPPTWDPALVLDTNRRLHDDRGSTNNHDSADQPKADSTPLSLEIPDTATEAVATALSQLHQAHARHNCTSTFLDDDARSRAAALDAERSTVVPTSDDLPLRGVPFTVKDVIDVAGAPTRGGSRTRSGAQPADRSAFAIARLEAAGAISIAKDSTTEFAASGPDTPLMGVCTNPWDTSRWAGGSSSGTAVAVATGSVPFGIGTDVGGSIRLPAAWCGITGLKPTAGRVSRSGVIPMSWSAEAVGPLGRDAATVSAVFRVMAGEDTADPRTHGDSAEIPPDPPEVAGMTLAVPTDPLFTDCDASIHAGLAEVREVLAGEGATSRETRLPDAEHAQEAGYQIVFPELAAVHRPLTVSWDDYGPLTSRRMSRGITSPVSDYLRAQHFAHHLQTVLLRELSRSTAILVPTVAGSAPDHVDAHMTINGERVPAFGHQARITMIGNLTGFPGLSFPIGFDAEGMPVSAMLIGRPREEHLLLGLARRYQERTDHHTRRPPLVPSASAEDRCGPTP